MPPPYSCRVLTLCQHDNEIKRIVLLQVHPNFLYSFLYKIPVVNNFRAPERYLFIFAFGISVLAGLGIQAIQQGLVQKQKKITFILSALFAGFLIACVLYIYPSLKVQALEKVKKLNFMR